MHATQPPPTLDSTPTDTVSPADALRLAADYLTQHGWIQHDYYAPGADSLNPAACALGALAIVCYGQPIANPFDDGTDDGQQIADPNHINRWHDFVTAHHALIVYLNRNSGCIGMPVDDWNDTPGYTAIRIIGALRAAADYAATAFLTGEAS